MSALSKDRMYHEGTTSQVVFSILVLHSSGKNVFSVRNEEKTRKGRRHGEIENDGIGRVMTTGILASHTIDIVLGTAYFH